MKISQVDFHPDFSEDLASAAEYFVEHASDRVEDLLADYNATLDAIVEAPDLYAVREEDGLRRANLDVFAYSIRYDWADGTVTVLTFAHHHQDAARWLRRLALLRRK